MEKKFLIFLEIAKTLNAHGIVPILYGSLGLYRIIGELGKINDIDIAIPEIYLKERFNELVRIMAEMGYKQDPAYPHEFTKGEGQIGFEPEEEFKDYDGIDWKNFKTTKKDDVEFKELSAEDYLIVYKKNSEIRKQKIKSMKPKIEALEKFLKLKESQP